MSIAEIHQTYSVWCNYKFQPKKDTWWGMDNIQRLCGYFKNSRYITVRTSCMFWSYCWQGKTYSWLIDEYEIDLCSADDHVLYNSILLLYFILFPFKDICGPRVMHKLSILRFITLILSMYKIFNEKLSVLLYLYTNL